MSYFCIDPDQQNPIFACSNTVHVFNECLWQSLVACGTNSVPDPPCIDGIPAEVSAIPLGW